MILYILIAIILGIIAGTITGLIPGIHINLISTLLISLPIIILIPEITSILFIVSMAITHTFIDFIPSTFLGAPDEDTALGVLLGHKYLLKGNSQEAILLTLVGSSIAIILLIIIIPLFFLIIPKTYLVIERVIPFALITISIFLVAREKSSKMWATLIFILAGFLGIATLNSQINQPLLPLLTGLFGSSTLIYSIHKKTKTPSQKIINTKEKLKEIIKNKKQLIKPIIATTIVSPICSFLPGLGSSQAAIISSEIFPKKKSLNEKQFLILLGSINTLVIAVSFITLYLMNKTRTGAASTIQQISSLSPQYLVLILVTIIITSIISIPLTIFLSKFVSKNIHKLNYTLTSKIIIILLSVIIIVISGFFGFLVFLTSTFLGLLCISIGCRRGFLMGSLLIPTILLYLPL